MSAALCSWCAEAFAPGESIEPGHVHYECGLRSVLGSVGHQRGLCSCYGGTEEDPPHMTRRQAAQAAAGYFHLGTLPAPVADKEAT
jgi:hypothetical protein